MQKRPEFEDFEEENAGILDSAGLDDYDKISTKLASDGVKVFLNCRFCNRPKQIDVDWQELATLAANSAGAPPVLPPQWEYSKNNSSAYISMRCPNCGTENGVAVHMSPEEARKHVQAGINAAFVSPAFVQQVSGQVLAARQRMRR